MCILFLEDWAKYPSAIVDYQTKNHTFLQFASDLKAMGVENWQFVLQLLNPRLQGIDPHSEDLDHTTQVEIIFEATYNPFYFIREVLRIPANSGSGGNQLIANRANIALWWCFLSHIIFFLEQIRQTGKSVNADGIEIWFQILGGEGAESIIFTKNDLIRGNIARLKKFRDLLPPYFVTKHKKDLDNQKEFTYMHKGNRVTTYGPQGDPEAANKVGRGKSPGKVHVDESPFLAYLDISLPALLAGTSASFDEALRKGQPHGIIMTTTPGDLSTDEGKYAYEITQKAMFWNESLYDSRDKQHLYERILANSRSEFPTIYGKFSHRQLGYSDDWLRKKIAVAGGARDQIERDWLGRWTTGSATNPIHENLRRRMRASRMEPLYTESFDGGYDIRWYVDEWEVREQFPTRQLLLCMDTSNAINRDAITGIFLDISTLETVGAFTVGESNLQTFSEWLADVLVAQPQATVIGENKSSWQSIVDALIVFLAKRGIDPGKRIWCRVVHDCRESETDKRIYERFRQNGLQKDHYNPYRQEFGFITSASSREQLYGPILQTAAKTLCDKVRDSLLINELDALTEIKGRIDHKSGGHDDHVFAWLIGNWLLTYGRNLEHYGIDVAKIKSDVYETAAENDWKRQRQLAQQKLLRAEIDQIEARLDERDVGFGESRILQSKLAILYSELENADVKETVNNLDRINKDLGERQRQVARQAPSLAESMPERGGLAGFMRNRRNPGY